MRVLYLRDTVYEGVSSFDSIMGMCVSILLYIDNETLPINVICYKHTMNNCEKLIYTFTYIQL